MRVQACTVARRGAPYPRRRLCSRGFLSGTHLNIGYLCHSSSAQQNLCMPKFCSTEQSSKHLRSGSALLQTTKFSRSAGVCIYQHGNDSSSEDDSLIIFTFTAERGTRYHFRPDQGVHPVPTQSRCAVEFFCIHPFFCSLCRVRRRRLALAEEEEEKD